MSRIAVGNIAAMVGPPAVLLPCAVLVFLQSSSLRMGGRHNRKNWITVSFRGSTLSRHESGELASSNATSILPRLLPKTSLEFGK